MEDTTYRPWRTTDAEQDMLAGQVSANWQRLLDDSRQAVALLRQATQQADRRIAISRHLLSAMRGSGHPAQFDRIMHRLNAMEKRLSRIEMRLSLDHPGTHQIHRHAA